MITKSSEALQAQGIDDSVIVNYSMALLNESRIKNADLIAAISNAAPQEGVIVVHNVIARANLTTDPSAKQIRLSEESVFSTIFTETYADILAVSRRMFGDFSQNARFNSIMRRLKKDPSLRKRRPLDPKTPEGYGKDFYHKRIYDELAKHYTLRADASGAVEPPQASTQSVI
jgi:sigma54-dependent transcription regulator